MQARTLLTDQKIAVQQISFISRAVAILAPVFPDVASTCLSGFEADFAKLLVNKPVSLTSSPHLNSHHSVISSMPDPGDTTAFIASRAGLKRQINRDAIVM